MPLPQTCSCRPDQVSQGIRCSLIYRNTPAFAAARNGPTRRPGPESAVRYLPGDVPGYLPLSPRPTAPCFALRSPRDSWLLRPRNGYSKDPVSFPTPAPRHAVRLPPAPESARQPGYPQPAERRQARFDDRTRPRSRTLVPLDRWRRDGVRRRTPSVMPLLPLTITHSVLARVS